MRKGIPVSPGVAVGVAYCIHEIFINPDTKRLEDHEITAELANYETARDEASAELRALQQLARLKGVQLSYLDMTGEQRWASPETLLAVTKISLCRAMMSYHSGLGAVTPFQMNRP